MSHILDIIIPEYDCPIEFMTRLLDSINKQKNINFKEIGIIIINDKSKNKYKKSWFKQRYPKLNIEYLIKDINEGQGLTRQYGLDRSEASYVTFIDQDDMLADNNSLSLVINQIKTSNEVTRISTCSDEETNIDGKLYRVHYDNSGLLCLHALYLRRQFLLDNNIRFSDTIRYHEDVYFTNIINYLTFNSNIFINETTYLWKWNEKSQVRSDKSIYFHLEDFIKAKFESLKFINNITKPDESFVLANIFTVYALLASNIVDDDSSKDKKNEFEICFYNNVIEYIELLNKLNNNDIDIFTKISLESHYRMCPNMILKESFKDFINRLENTYGNKID